MIDAGERVEGAAFLRRGPREINRQVRGKLIAIVGEVVGASGKTLLEA